MSVKAQNTYLVSIPPRPNGWEFHAAINALDGCHEDVKVMAGGLDFVTPRDLCGLRALLDHAAANGHRVEFDCPTKRGVHRHLERMNFYEDLVENVELSQRRLHTRCSVSDTSLIELVRIRASEEVELLMERVSKIAFSEVNSRRLAIAFATAIGAATENVVEHAESPIGALVAAQRYESTGLELAVVDLGAGIPATLARNPLHSGLTDIDAVRRALKDGVSSLDGEGRGTGLWELVKAVSKGGNSTLAIGSGMAAISIGGQQGKEAHNMTTPAYAIRGTWISVRLEG